MSRLQSPMDDNNNAHAAKGYRFTIILFGLNPSIASHSMTCVWQGSDQGKNPSIVMRDWCGNQAGVQLPDWLYRRFLQTLRGDLPGDWQGSGGLNVWQPSVDKLLNKFWNLGFFLIGPLPLRQSHGLGATLVIHSLIQLLIHSFTSNWRDKNKHVCNWRK